MWEGKQEWGMSLQDASSFIYRKKLEDSERKKRSKRQDLTEHQCLSHIEIVHFNVRKENRNLNSLL